MPNVVVVGEEPTYVFKDEQLGEVRIKESNLTTDEMVYIMFRDHQRLMAVLGPYLDDPSSLFAKIPAPLRSLMGM
jgi:hypothetical protein